MKKQIAVLVSALLMGGGTYAQNGAQAQKPKAYMVSDAHLDMIHQPICYVVAFLVSEIF